MLAIDVPISILAGLALTEAGLMLESWVSFLNPTYFSSI